MKKKDIHIYMPENIMEILKRIRNETGTSIAETVRRALYTDLQKQGYLKKGGVDLSKSDE